MDQETPKPKLQKQTDASLGDWITLIKEVFRLVVLVVGEIFEEKKRARLREEAYRLSQEKFADLVVRVATQLRTQAVTEGEKARKIEDELDQRLRDSRAGDASQTGEPHA